MQWLAEYCSLSRQADQKNHYEIIFAGACKRRDYMATFANAKSRVSRSRLSACSEI